MVFISIRQDIDANKRDLNLNIVYNTLFEFVITIYRPSWHYVFYDSSQWWQEGKHYISLKMSQHPGGGGGIKPDRQTRN